MDISRRAGGQDDKVFRCSCGGWAYKGNSCQVCYLLDKQKTTPNDVTPVA